MIIICWSAKGGSGTTVAAAALGLLATRSLLVDLAGDLPVALGLDVAARAGVRDWLDSAAPRAHLPDLAIDVDTDTMLIPCGRRIDGTRRIPCGHQVGEGGTEQRWDEFGRWLVDWVREFDGTAVIDAGSAPPPSHLLRHADRDLLVARTCYLSLTAATRIDHRATGVLLMREPGRALRPRDVTTALGVPVVAEIPYDTKVSRAVDSGLLASRLPPALRRAARKAMA